MKYLFSTIFALLLINFSFIVNAQTNNYSSQEQSTTTSNQGSDSCPAPYFVPPTCPAPYVPGQKGGYTANLNCPLNQFLSKTNVNCCPNICVDRNGNLIGSISPDLIQPNPFSNFEVFGTTIRIDPNNAPALINLLFSTFLGIVSLYTIARGIYVAGVKRSSAVSAEDISNVSKELTNLLVGALISWGFIIVIQLIAGVLGVGQLNNLDVSSANGLVITIK